MDIPRVSRSEHANGKIPPTSQPRGIPKASSLTGNQNVVLPGKNFDLRNMNGSVDDSTDPKLDEGVRCIQFLPAVANVDALLSSPTHHRNGSSAHPDIVTIATSSSSESETANVECESQGSTTIDSPEEPTASRKEHFKKMLAFFQDGTETASSSDCSTGTLQKSGIQTFGSESKARSDASSGTMHQDTDKNIHDQASSPSKRIPKLSSLTWNESTFTDGKPHEQANGDIEEISSPVSPIEPSMLSSMKWGQSIHEKIALKNSTRDENTSRGYTPKGSTIADPDRKPKSSPETTGAFPRAKHIDKEDVCEKLALNRIPKVSSLTRNESTFTDGKLDAGHLDISVDDGADVALDKGTRSMRFFAAAANIEAIFGSRDSSQNNSICNGAIPRTPSNSGSGTDEDSNQRLKKPSPKHTLATKPFRSDKSRKGEEYIYIEPVTPSSLKLRQKKNSDAGGTSHSISDNSSSLKKVSAIPQRLNEIQANPIDLKVVDGRDYGDDKPHEQANGDIEEISSPVSPIERSMVSSMKWGQSLHEKSALKNSTRDENTSRGYTPKGSTIENPDHKASSSSLEMIFSRNSRTTMAFQKANCNGKDDTCEEGASSNMLDTMVGSSKRMQTPKLDGTDRTEDRRRGAQNLLGSCFPWLDVPGINNQQLNCSLTSPSTQTDSNSNHLSTKIRGLGAGEWICADATRHNLMMKPDSQQHVPQQRVEQSGSPESKANAVGRRRSWKRYFQKKTASFRGRIQLYLSRLTD